jgi:phosphoribosylamine--glycine ligase
MKFLFLSCEGNTCEMARRVQLEGNTVHIWIKSENCKKTLDGLIPKVDNWERYANRNTIIIVDHVKMSGIAQSLIDSGYQVINGSKFADKLELDRELGHETMKQNGIKTPNFKEFTDFGQAISFLNANKKKRYVFKPSGNLELDWSYIGTDVEDLIERIEHKFKPEWPSGKPIKFVLEEFIKGIEVSTEIWFSHGQIINQNGTMEEKKLLTGSLGPSIGCAGNIVWNYTEPPTKSCIVGKTLEKLKELLTKENYCGVIDINCIVSEEDDEPYGIEFTTRFGYDALQAWLETINGDIGAMLYDAVNGRMIHTNSSFACAVRVNIPPFPFDKADKRAGDLIRFDQSLLDTNHYWFFDCEKKDGNLQVVGVDGIICVVTDKGNTIERSIERCYKNIEAIKSPRDIMYRTDIGKRVPKEYKILERAGLV